MRIVERVAAPVEPAAAVFAAVPSVADAGFASAVGHGSVAPEHDVWKDVRYDK